MQELPQARRKFCTRRERTIVFIFGPFSYIVTNTTYLLTVLETRLMTLPWHNVKMCLSTKLLIGRERNLWTRTRSGTLNWLGAVYDR